MDNDTLNDLKQFITATVTQATADLATKEDVERLDRKNEAAHAEIMAAIADTMTTNTESTDADITDLKRRVTVLEQKTAQ